MIEVASPTEIYQQALNDCDLVLIDNVPSVPVSMSADTVTFVQYGKRIVKLLDDVNIDKWE